MDEQEIETIIIEQMNITDSEKIIIPERVELFMALHRLQFMTVGQADRYFCNSFLREIVRLLINSLFLYEEGYFDCAFYSIRQAAEVGNNMLFIANKGQSELAKWNSKGYFPMNKNILLQLLEVDKFYSEVKTKAADFFKKQDDLIKESHKIIHKQGFDTFYKTRKELEYKKQFSKEDETTFFIDVLKHTICYAIILYIIVDPISLVLTDDELSMRFNFDPLVEPADVGFLEMHLSTDIVSEIKSTNYFTEISDFFKEKELMLPAVFEVVRNHIFDIEALEDINSQSHLLSYDEKTILKLLMSGIELTNIYPDCLILGYSTSIRSKYNQTSWNTSEYDQYLNCKEVFNLSYCNIYRSIVKGLDYNWILEHNDPLSKVQIGNINNIFIEFKNEYQAFLNSIE